MKGGVTMKRDPIVLGENYILSGNEIGTTRPNGNALIVGTTGCGKSTSVVIPTMGRSCYSNPILSYAKERDGYAMARYLRKRGYDVGILNIMRPKKSTIGFDPLLSIESYEDIDALVGAIIDATIKRTNDDYWPLKSKPLLASLIGAAMMTADDDKEAGMEDVLELFDRLIPVEDGYSVTTKLDGMFRRLEEASPGCYAVREYNAWHTLPYRTAACVRDTLASALSTVFPESVRTIMRDKPQFDVEKFANNKAALIVITSAIETSQQYYANLFYRDTERQLIRYAAERPKGELPREVRYVFDDFACTAPIQGWANDISLFRSAGISAIMLLQSEQQLEAIYEKDAPIIRQNCSVYCYYPGGFDDRSCEIVSKRMGIPYEEVLYAPLGKVFIMQSGQRPVHIPRYDTLGSDEYRDYMSSVREGRRAARSR